MTTRKEKLVKIFHNAKNKDEGNTFHLPCYCKTHKCVLYSLRFHRQLQLVVHPVLSCAAAQIVAGL